MQVHVKMHGILRDKLPSGSKGMLILDLGDKADVHDLVDALAQRMITGPFEVAVNGELAEDIDLRLADGMRVDIFRAGGGG